MENEHLELEAVICSRLTGQGSVINAILSIMLHRELCFIGAADDLLILQFCQVFFVEA